MLDCAGEIVRQKAVLERIVALLLALAALAERAALLPAAQRARVLAVLLHGEAVARDHVTGLAHALGAPVVDVSDEVAAEAAALAARLRGLALLLAALIVCAGRHAGRRSAAARPGGQPVPQRGLSDLAKMERRAVAAPDTS